MDIILFKEKDNVVTAIQKIYKNTMIKVSENKEILVIDEIEFGHKIAITDICKEEPIMKYGVPIGFATMEIKTGEHVHTHNLKDYQRDGER